MTQAFLENLTFELSQKAGQTLVNGKEVQPEIKRINDQLFQVGMNGKSYDVFIHKVDQDNREVEISVNGKKDKVKLQSRVEKLLKELGMESALVKKMSSLKAPMPGLIHAINVEAGQEVKQGDPLLILEAMKMENVIKAEGDGVVSNIHIQEKDSVEKGHLLISFE